MSAYLAGQKRRLWAMVVWVAIFCVLCPQAVKADDSVKAEVSLQETVLLSPAEDVLTYTVCIDNAVCLTALWVEMEFESSQVEKGNILSQSPFAISHSVWKKEGDTLKLQAYFGIDGAGQGYTATTPMPLATISVPLVDKAAETVAVKLTKAVCAGIPANGGKAVDGIVKIGKDTAVYVKDDAISYDINGDGTVNQLDITEAQKYYQATKDSANWETARIADVDRSGVVDIQDLITIFLHLEI
ncbi:MAG: hypothetical protein IKI88_06365 [Anaerotignum sp.]|nr:hypothetical protein [Anaerotignum sp.]